MVKEKRNSNVELLRIVSMNMVILMHGMQELQAFDLPEIGMLYKAIKALCIVAVNVFVLISGYYYTKPKFRIRATLSLVLSTWSYTVLVALFRIVFTKGEYYPSVIDILPLLSRRYWFVNTYIGLSLLEPFLGKLSNSLKDKELLLLSMVLVGVFSVRPSLFPATWCLDSSGGYSLIWFISLFFSAAGIHRWNRYLPSRKIITWGGYLFAALCVVLINEVIRDRLGNTYAQKYYNYNNTIVLFESICLFAATIQMQPQYSKVINFFAQHTFSAYILSYAVNDVLWTSILGFSKDSLGTFSGCLRLIVQVFIVFLICAFVDAIVTTGARLIKKRIPLSSAIDRWIDKTQIKLDQVLE